MTHKMILSLVLVFSFCAQGAFANGRDNIKIKPTRLEAPSLDEFAKEEKLLSSSGHSELPKRKPASGNKIVGSEDLMTAELKAFRDKLVKTRHAEQLDALLREHNAKYDTLPNDLKYVVARLSPLLAFRGFFWRMSSLAHQAVVSQEVLLAGVRATAEQAMIFEPDTQWQAYMTFFAIPNADLLKVPASKGDGVNRPDMKFYTENDLSDFFATEVYSGLSIAVNRMAALRTTVDVNGKSTAIVFDNKIRFGENAFNQAYDAVDRFSLIGDAEKYAVMARFHRRMATIAQMAAYNMNGNIALRREIGKKYGVDAAISSILPGVDDAYDVDGLTRVERVTLARSHRDLFRLRNGAWMKTAYGHFHQWAKYSAEGWKLVRNESRSYDTLLDPDLFAGRKEQIDKAVATSLRLFPNPAKDGSTTVVGAISGDELRVNTKDFFYNPPDDLKKMMPTQFNQHQDIEPLKAVYGASLKPSRKSQVEMKIEAGGHQQTVEWRNYLFGRATGWDPAAYARLFPGVNSPDDIARAQRILGETRGARQLLTALATVVK